MSTPAGAQLHGHVQGEAFMLMQYECSPSDTSRFGGPPPKPACGNVEIVWNSRDGVTPYVIDCRHCGGQARHVRWHADLYAPDHRPAVGERVFVDLNPERALEKRKVFVERWWDDPQMPMREHPHLGPMGKDGAAAELAAADVASFAPHTPDLVTVEAPSSPARSWTLEVVGALPATPNDRGWRKRWARTKVLRREAWGLAKQQRIPALTKIRVGMTVIPPDRRRRDEDNLVGTMKPLVDGLVDAGVIPDDTGQYVERVFPTIAEPDGSKRWRYQLHIEEVAG